MRPSLRKIGPGVVLPGKRTSDPQRAAKNPLMSRASKDRLWTGDFALIFSAAAAFYLGHQIVLPVLPLYVEELGGSASSAGLANGVYLLFAVLTNLAMPRVLAGSGRKTVIIVGVALLTAGTLAYTFAVTLAMLMVLSVVRGVGWGSAVVAGNTTVAETVPATRRGEGIGYYALAQTLALLGGASLGLLLVERFGFVAAFLAAGLPGVAATVAIAVTRPILPARTSSQEAMKMSDAFRDPHLLLPAIAFALTALVYGGVVSFAASYITASGLGNPVAFFLVSAAFNVVARPVCGRLSDRAGAATLIAPGVLLSLLGIGVLAVATGTVTLYFAAVLFGLGFGTVVVSTQVTLVERAGNPNRAVGNAMFSVAFNGGMGVGAFLLGVVADETGYDGMFRTALIPLAASFIVSLLDLSRTRRALLASPSARPGDEE